MLTGALHAHSTYSDGEFTLAELREIFSADGCSFLCMTDHAEYFDEQSIARYMAECESLCDDKFLLIAGLEYRCERDMHVLGYCATKLTSSTNPEEVFRHIAAQQAVSVYCSSQERFLPVDRRVRHFAGGHRNLEHEVRWPLRSASRNLRAAAAPEAAVPRNACVLWPGLALEKTISRIASSARLRFAAAR